MKTPKVSVIMPAYNTGKYIEAAIESILNQTFMDFEFIILNDGSTDNTPNIIEEYAKKDNRIKFINNSKNQGFIASLNQCLDIAKGEYIAKMDSDDISLPRRLEKQVQYLDAHPEVGMVGTNYQFFDKRDTIKVSPAKVGLLDLYVGCLVLVVMFRKEIVDKYCLRFRPEYVHAEDYDFYARFLRYTEIHNIQEILYLYRWHGNNVSIQKSDIQAEHCNKIRRDILNFLTRDGAVQREIKKIMTPEAMTPEVLKLKRKYYLFNFIPILRMKRKGKKTKFYLFGIIPLLKVKEK